MDDAALLEKYQSAATYLMTYFPTGNASFDLRIQGTLYNAHIELERRGLTGTLAYSESVLKADRNARGLRAHMLKLT